MQGIPIKANMIGPGECQSPNLKALAFDWYYKGHKIVGASGPRNCSKTTTIMQLMLWLHNNIPGLQSAAVRCEASTMKSTIIKTLEELIGYPFGDKRNKLTLHGGPNRPQHINFDNGGQMLFGGMDDHGNKILGGAYDLFFYNQIERELDIEIFQKIMGCMAGGRKGNLVVNGKRTFLFIGDANPSFKKHWFYQMRNDIAWYDITHKDHPLFYDWEIDDWTEHGQETIDDLLATHPPGYMRDRMVYGIWNNPEGAVYPQYDPDVHDIAINRDDIPAHAQWRFSCDWGSINAVGLYAEYNGKHYLFKEIYRKFESVQDIIARMNALKSTYNIPDITNTFVDHEIDNRYQVQDAGYDYTLAGKRDVAGGIEDVKYALSNGLIYFNTQSLDDPDPQLRGKPQRLTDEIAGLAYKEDEKMNGTRSDDLPDNKHADHACDHLRYYIVGCAVRPQVGYPAVMKPVNKIQAGEMTFGA